MYFSEARPSSSTQEYRQAVITHAVLVAQPGWWERLNFTRTSPILGDNFQSKLSSIEPFQCQHLSRISSFHVMEGSCPVRNDQFRPQEAHLQLKRAYPKPNRDPSKIKWVKGQFFFFCERPIRSRSPQRLTSPPSSELWLRR